MADPLTNPPAQPKYILRGHSAQIHAVHFFRKNSRLLTGDADGWVIVWNTTTKRAAAVWQAHNNTILGLSDWGPERIITHGRDNKLNIWSLKTQDESDLSTVLPIEHPSLTRKKPWLLHSLPVNALNFCAFARCLLPPTSISSKEPEELLIATPGLQDGHINVTSLPSESRVATIPGPEKGTNTGMVMAIGLHLFSASTPAASPAFAILAGYESGHISIWLPSGTPSSTSNQMAKMSKWTCAHLSKPHTQPVLSLAISPQSGTFFTSSADALLARHPLPTSTGEATPSSLTVRTGHAGQQSLNLRSDGKLLATAGWDGRIRVYDPQTLGELAVLKWHREGCYAVAFAEIYEGEEGRGGGEKREGEGELEAVQGGEGEGIVGRTGQGTVASRRAERSERTHWVAAGSKDGKVSLWDIY